MPWERYALGYHGCDDALAKAIVAGRVRLRSSQNDYDWLGHGLYFWEDNAKRAFQWAKAQSRDPRRRIRRPGVLGAVIDLGNCLNLIDAEYLKLVRKAHSRLVALFAAAGKPLPQNVGRELGARKLDCAVLESLHSLRKEENRPLFDTVRAFFVEGEPLYPNAGIRQLDHIQVCVRNPKKIIGYFIPR